MADEGLCAWARGSSPRMRAYHDTEWGRPLHDERALFELLILEGAQAGLSWRTILDKRERYRQVFDDFDAERIARYDASDEARLLADPGIVRNRLKIAAAIGNARAVLKLRETAGGLSPWLWAWAEGRPLINLWRSPAEVPARTALSDAISKDLLKRGFKFVGSTIVYSFLQATGVVDDHLVTCPCHTGHR